MLSLNVRGDSDGVSEIVWEGVHVEKSPIIDLVLHLDAPALAEGVEVSRLGTVTARHGLLWRNRPLAGVLFLFCRDGALEIARAGDGPNVRRKDRGLPSDGNGTVGCRAGEMLVLLPGLPLTSAASETRLAYLELAGPKAVRATLRLGFWDGFRAPCPDGGFLDDLAASFEASPLRGRDERLLSQVEEGLDLIWQNARRLSRCPAFFSALRVVSGLPMDARTTEKAAEALGISRSKLNQLFLAGLGRRPGDLLAEMKAAVVGELLADATLSVSQVALRTGFSSASALACFFRRWRDITPGRFRETLDRHRLVQKSTNSSDFVQGKSSLSPTETL